MWHRTPWFSLARGLKKIKFDSDIRNMAQPGVESCRIDVYIE